MKVDYRVDGDIVIVILIGELDEHNSCLIRDDVDSFLRNCSPLRVVIFDFCKVSFIDSTGLGFLLSRYKKLKERKVEILIANAKQNVDKVLKTSGVYKFMPKIR